MSNNYFQFKQFTVWQDRTAMKVGTDGVLLGTLAIGNKNTKHILDIGTGTGLVALMLAQRFSTASIDAVEIDIDAYEQAVDNFKKSPFGNRLNAIKSDISDYKSEIKYNLVVSNPPYFVDSLKNPNKQRAIARHNLTLDFATLCQSASRLLNENGTFSVVIPTEAVDELNRICQSFGLYTYQRTDVKTTPNKTAKRSVINYSFSNNLTINNRTIVIENEPLKYSPEFAQLIHDFYLEK